MPQPRSNHTRPAPPPPKPEFDPIDPVWLLKAIGYTILAALVCGYLTLCLLFYQGQWQLILHPKPSAAPLTTLGSTTSQIVHFDASETGSPRLSGALIPATAESRYAPYTILYLRSGEESLAQSANDARNLALLHALDLSVFAFDYRGYGQSDPAHPNQARMTEDAQAALRYLTDTRAIPVAHIILFGTGVGASLATSLAATHPQIPALILDSPGQTPSSIIAADPRTRLLPTRALFHDDFPLKALDKLPTPKLLLTNPSSGTYPAAASPKITVELPTVGAKDQATAITRFLDQYLAR